jgi:hypothetical protein
MRGFHSFRRYRNTFLRQSRCPEVKFWLGHSDKSLSDTYDRSAEDVQFRRDVATSLGTGFVLPATISGKTKTPFKSITGRPTGIAEHFVNA